MYHKSSKNNIKKCFASFTQFRKLRPVSSVSSVSDFALGGETSFAWLQKFRRGLVSVLIYIYRNTKMDQALMLHSIEFN